MKDRIPTEVLSNGAIRYAEYDITGNLVGYHYFLLADEPTEIGTALNKASLLTDNTATAFGLNGNTATVNDALSVSASRGKAFLVCEIIQSTRNWRAPTNIFGNQIFVRLFGAGGGGGGCEYYSSSSRTGDGGGGGAGHFVEAWLTISKLSTYSVSIGTGGAGGDASDGSDGGSTSFGTLISAAGGKGGKKGGYLVNQGYFYGAGGAGGMAGGGSGGAGALGGSSDGFSATKVGGAGMAATSGANSSIYPYRNVVDIVAFEDVPFEKGVSVDSINGGGAGIFGNGGGGGSTNAGGGGGGFLGAGGAGAYGGGGGGGLGAGGAGGDTNNRSGHAGGLGAGGGGAYGASYSGGIRPRGGNGGDGFAIIYYYLLGGNES